MGIGISTSEVQKAARLVGCLTFTTPFNYLGVKVGDVMSRINSWDEVTSKLSSCLSKWKLKALLIGVRLTLLKLVLTSIPVYHMSVFKVPIGVVNKMKSIRRIFFNGVEGLDREMAWIGSSLWVRFIKATHNEKGALDNCISTSRMSPWFDIIRDLICLKSKGIDLLALSRKKVGNNEDSLFWDDIWLGDATLKAQYPKLYALESHKDISMAEKMRDPMLVHTYHRPPRRGAEEEQNCHLHSRIADFSIKSVRNLIDDTILPKEDVPTRLVKAIPINVNILARRVRLDKLPTRLNLSLRGVEIPSILCPKCCVSVESASHLFFSCSLARQVRSKVLRWWELDNPEIFSYED
ncbi:RNA-directed DNA polymerase, eukaryota, reverse transcriptase zinc-binding domain protein [Tanacetum coccineum]